ncbi:MAG: putative acetyltransferase [Chloroflexi bacterium ADurb.Bin325]|nr:MAG: putative acetyltransferase [Chloroflexi bacterium ADurb.Bin325]
MHIYRADLRDLAACLALDGSYETDYVWQVTQQQDTDQVVTRFQTIRLPRAMRVQYPGWSEALLAHQQRGDLILVAAEVGDVRAYLDQETQPDQGIAWLHHLVVAPAYRRQGLGAALLARGIQHGRQHGLTHMMTVVQSKNYPAIQFLTRQGFRFCGYNERFYRNRDIGLYFARGL